MAVPLKFDITTGDKITLYLSMETITIQLTTISHNNCSTIFVYIKRVDILLYVEYNKYKE